MLTKKGQFDVARKSIYWMLAGITVTVAVLAFAMILSSYQSKSLQIPPHLRAELVSLRFLNTPECFTYQDPSGRVFPGMIDLDKFTQERLNQCYQTSAANGKKDYNFGISLKGYDLVQEDGSEQLLMTNNYFKKVDFTLTKNVLVRSGKELTPTQMLIFVQKRI
jgi:hypothetical protein